MPPHPTPPHPISSVATYIIYEVQGTLTCPPPHPTPPHNRDIQKRAFYGNGFRSAGIYIYVYIYILCLCLSTSMSMP